MQALNLTTTNEIKPRRSSRPLARGTFSGLHCKE